MKKKILLILLIILLIIVGYFFVGFPKPKEGIIWGVNFSQKHAKNLGLDWQETYLALFDDLGAKNLKIAAHWDLIESEEGKYNFEDLDWQIQKAEEKGAKLLLVLGMKVPRWPECHLLEWAKIQNSKFLPTGDLLKGDKNQKLLEYIKEIVNRYKDSPVIWAWQVENEPFFPFGECPEFDKDLFEKEIALVKSLDSKRPVIISESGEFFLWFRAAKYGDIVGVTMYRKVWFGELKNYINYPFPAIFYQRRAKLINRIFGKEVICVELQAEPWGPKLLYDLPLEEQEKTMNLEQFRKNIEFAKKTGLKEFYLWGAEWWYWLKEKQNQPEIWQEARKLFAK